MTKYIDSKTSAYFPQLGKRTSWEDAFEAMANMLFLDTILYDKVIVSGVKNHEYSLEYTVLRGTGPMDDSGSLPNGERLVQFIFKGGERKNLILGPGEYDFDALWKNVIEYCITNKILKKPRKSKNISATDDITELRKMKSRITMKICSWKRVGKDVTELENEKNDIIKRIKKLL